MNIYEQFLTEVIDRDGKTKLLGSSDHLETIGVQRDHVNPDQDWNY